MNEPEPQAGSSTRWLSGFGHNGINDFSGQPIGRVVLAQASPVVGGDDRFVEDAGDVGLGLVPIEPTDPGGDIAQPRLAADFHRPGEEVGLDNAADPGCVGEELSVEQAIRLVYY